jgi:hypothetical protein
MDSKECHITTFVRMAPCGTKRVGRRKAPPSKFFSSRTPGLIKKRGGESRGDGHKGTYGSLSRRVKSPCTASYDLRSHQVQSAIYSARRLASEMRTVAEASVHQWDLFCSSTTGEILMGPGTESADYRQVSHEPPGQGPAWESAVKMWCDGWWWTGRGKRIVPVR